ncbi:MAG TPA: glycosyltransferase [Mycobacteriales bacterium]|nr:glycosyltransferase [Mycobacteriales bacterium]
MRFAVITQLDTWSASTRHRAVQHVPRLRERLGAVDLLVARDVPRPRTGPLGRVLFFGSHGVRYVARWQELARRLPEYDAVLVQRGAYPIGPGALARPFEHYRGRLVLDLDDNLFVRSPSLDERGRVAQWLYGPQQAKRLVARADQVVVSTTELADALPRRDLDPVVLPTVPDPSAYQQARHGAVEPVIGWAGTNGGLRYLDPLREVLGNLRAEQLADVEVVSSRAWAGPSRFRLWTLAEEPTLFARFAVGIMPLPDTGYTRTKAGFKLLQYMAAGVPVVASPVGVNRELVERSGAGRLAETPSDWDRALRELLADPSLRSELGQRGREFLEQYADLDGQADQLAELLAG